MVIAYCDHAGLRAVPTFSANVTHVYMESNPITFIPKDAFPTSLHHLSMVDCSLKFIEKGAFKKLSELSVLNLSFNRELSFAILPNITSDLIFTSITSLYLTGIHCVLGYGTEIRREHFAMLENTSLKRLFLGSNRISFFERGAISSLPSSLELINLANNKLQLEWYVIELLCLKNLKFADFSNLFDSYTNLPVVSLSCNDAEFSNDENVITKILPSGHSQNIPLFEFMGKSFNITIHLPPKLLTLTIESSAIPDQIPGLRIAFASKMLQELNLSGNNIQCVEQSSLITDTVLYLDLSGNDCKIITDLFFRDAIALRDLKLSNNYLGSFLDSEESENIFENQKNIVRIDLSDNRIQSLTKNLFRYSSKMEIIHLHTNQMTHINLNFHHMKSLRLIDLSSNQIRFLSEENMKDIDLIKRSGNLTIDLNKNSLRCDCSSLKFLRWMLSNQKMFRFYEEYSCTFLNGTKGSFLDLNDIVRKLDLKCQSKTPIIVASVIFIATVLLSVMFAIVYRYRWSIRYLFYAAKREYRKYFHRPEMEREADGFQYDAFVSYADEDRTLVIDNFIRVIERNSENRLRLCLHNRDFVPGKEVEENISDAIHGSRKTICVLSKSYLASHWCMFEYNMARMESIYFRSGEEVLFLVLLEDFSVEGIPMSMLHMVERKTYLEFPHQDVDNPAFWSKIKEVISS